MLTLAVPAFMVDIGRRRGLFLLAFRCEEVFAPSLQRRKRVRKRDSEVEVDIQGIKLSVERSEEVQRRGTMAFNTG